MRLHIKFTVVQSDFREVFCPVSYYETPKNWHDYNAGHSKENSQLKYYGSVLIMSRVKSGVLFFFCPKLS